MIATTKTPAVLHNLLNTYKAANDTGKAYETIKACIFHNNEPVNILSAVTALKDVRCLVNIDYCHPVSYELTLRYLSDVTGYTVLELEAKSLY